MKVFLETERLILRQFTEEDADNLFELDSDPDVVRFTRNLGQLTPYIVIKTEILPEYLADYEKYDGYGCWAAIEKSSKAFIGWFLFIPIIEDASCLNPKLANFSDVEIGYRLGKAFWGKGYATEGVKALIFKGLSDLGTKRIFAGAFAVNTASIRVMEKAGLKLKERLFSEEIAQEAVIYELNQH